MGLTTAARRSAAMLDRGVVMPDGELDSSDRAALLGIYLPSVSVQWFGPLTAGAAYGAEVDGSTPISRRLMRHYGTVTEGRNVYILTDGTVTETDPVGEDGWALVSRVLWGGHVEIVTTAEALLLTSAGYGAYLS